jgi:hypothetical protein
VRGRAGEQSIRLHCCPVQRRASEQSGHSKSCRPRPCTLSASQSVQCGAATCRRRT